MRLLFKILLVGILYLFYSCSSVDNQLDLAMDMAGSNRAELQKVLDRYKDEDPEKYRAACFLIENMPFHYHYDNKGLDNYLKYFEAYSKTNKKRPQSVVDSLKNANIFFDESLLSIRRDIKYIDSATLIDNIEWSFKVWNEQPWGKNVSFNDFCEYILPYSIGSEPTTSWKKDIYEKFNHQLDSIRLLPEAEDPFFVGKYIIDKWESDKKFKWTGLFPDGPNIGPKTIEWKVGSCREFTDGVIYILRALGIPCGTDKTLMRGDNNASHFWAFVLDKNRMPHTIEPGKPFKDCKDTKIVTAKIHRNTYSLNRKWKEIFDRVDDVYPIFRNATFDDVTAVYNDTTLHNITVAVKHLYCKVDKDKPIYLCSPNRDTWVPVDFSFIDSDGVTFNNICGGVVCSMGIWKDGRMSIVSDPFIIDKFTGKLRYYHPDRRYHIVDIYSKFSLFSSDTSYRMLGGVIEGSNRYDFLIKDTLYYISEAPYRKLNTVYLEGDKSYKYVRYKGAKGSYSNIAELFLYSDRNDSISLKGKIIGTTGCWDNDGSHEYTNVFDGDLYTSFDYKYEDGGWAGLAFDVPQKIRKLVYAPRNRDNFIRSGDVYELFFWGNGKWNTLGEQIAKTDELKYNVPFGALLFLKNHSRGKEERIFEIKNKIQVFR